MKDIILLCVGVAALVLGVIFYGKFAAALKAADKPDKKLKRKKTLMLILSVLGGYVLICEAIMLIFGKPESEKFTV